MTDVWVVLLSLLRVPSFNRHASINKAIIVPHNGFSPDRQQAIIWTNAGILSIRHLGTNFNEIKIAIHTFSFKKMHFKMSSANWQPVYFCLNVLSDVRPWKVFTFTVLWHPISQPYYNLTATEIMAWMSNYIPHFMWMKLHIQSCSNKANPLSVGISQSLLRLTKIMFTPLIQIWPDRIKLLHKLPIAAACKQ